MREKGDFSDFYTQKVGKVVRGDSRRKVNDYMGYSVRIFAGALEAYRARADHARAG